MKYKERARIKSRMVLGILQNSEILCLLRRGIYNNLFFYIIICNNLLVCIYVPQKKKKKKKKKKFAYMIMIEIFECSKAQNYNNP